MTSGGSSTPPMGFEAIVTPLPRSRYPKLIAFDPEDFKRADERPDPFFYQSPRFVQHIDNNCIARLREYYDSAVRKAAAERRGTHKQGARVLDLCSSWTSHLPDSLLPLPQSKAEISTSENEGQIIQDDTRRTMESCVGFGMNTNELAANKHLTAYFARDLNASPKLEELEDASIDIAICSVSIDYMTSSVELLGEVRRKLRVGGTLHCSFSNRCFPTKVIGKWLRMSESERTQWVGSYFWSDNEQVSEAEADGEWCDVEEVVLNRGGYHDPLYVVRARKVARK